MKLESFTLIVVPGPDAKVSRHRVEARALRRVLALGLSLVVVGLLGALHLAVLSREPRDNEAIRDQNRVMRAELQALRERLGALSSTIDRVDRIDSNLRSGAQLSNLPQGLAIGPTEDPWALLAAPEEAPLPAGPVRVEDLRQSLELLARKASDSESSLQSLHAYFQEQRSLLAEVPSIWPLRGVLTSAFGTRSDPFTAQPWAHSGLDLGAPIGTAVIAPADGTVVFAGLEGGYGNVVVLDHGRGIKTRYGHLSAFKVKPGDKVRRGQEIAAVGTTGRSTGPHLHYEVRVNGVARNPRAFILEE